MSNFTDKKVIVAFMLLLHLNCKAQFIRYCDGNKIDTTSCAKSLNSVFKKNNNILFYKNTPVFAICSLEGYFSIVFGNSERYKKAGFQIYCEDILINKPFNNWQNSVKQGLWIKTNIFGRIKNITQYDSGYIYTVLTFWPNGLPKRIVKYKKNGQQIQGANIFYENK